MVLCHPFHPRWREHTHIVQRHTAEQHPDKAGEVNRGRIQSATRVEHLRYLCWEIDWVGHELTFGTQVHFRDPLALRRTRQETRVLHPEGIEDVLIEVLIEALAGCRLDNLPRPVD